MTELPVHCCPSFLQGKSDAQRLDGWDTLYLEYKLEWPMGLLLTPPVIAK